MKVRVDKRMAPCRWLKHISSGYNNTIIQYNLATEMDVLRRSARKSRLERITNEHIKEMMEVKEDPDIIDIIERKRLEWYGHVKRMQEERLN